MVDSDPTQGRENQAGEDGSALGAGGYRKGQEARLRILRAALAEFGKDGFTRATTRAIAKSANVNLPAIKYYFENKEGLYLACAREIVERYEAKIGGLVRQVQKELEGQLMPELARLRLKAVAEMLVELMVTTEDASLWTSFVMREMTEQGPAFDILYRELWAPGMEMTAALISRVWGEPVTSEAARVRALLFHASLTAFSTSLPVARKFLHWRDLSGPRLALVRNMVELEIDRLGDAPV